MSRTTQFACVNCGYAYTKATTTNVARSAPDIRWRRVCLKCADGFVTYEVTAADYALLQSIRKWVKEGPYADGRGTAGRGQRQDDAADD